MILITIMAIDNEDDRQYILQLYLELYPLMKAAAYEILKDYSLADDIVHEAVVRLIDKIPVIQQLSRNQLAAYVHRTAHNLALKYQQKMRKTIHIHIDDWEVADQSQNFVEVFDKEDDYKALGQAMQKLSENDRELLYMKYYLEYSNQDIALIIGIKTDSIREYLTRARRRLLRILKTRG